MGVWVYGCMGVWVYGCMGVWVYWCMRQPIFNFQFQKCRTYGPWFSRACVFNTVATSLAIIRKILYLRSRSQRMASTSSRHAIANMRLQMLQCLPIHTLARSSPSMALLSIASQLRLCWHSHFMASTSPRMALEKAASSG